MESPIIILLFFLLIALFISFCMGVKLHDLIITNRIDYQSLKGRVLAIDAPNIIMSLLNFTRKNKKPTQSNLFFDRTQRVINHLYGILYRVIFFYSKFIFPLFCFDGVVSELKRCISKDQLNDYNFTKKRYSESIQNGNIRLAKQLATSQEFFWSSVIEESKRLLGLLGIPYIESPGSAESQCASLTKEGIANYSNSQDYDCLLFGCPYIIRNLSKSLRKKVKGRWIYKRIVPQKIDLKANLKQLDIDQFQLVDIGILIGTDYHPGIHNIGPKTAFKLIKEHKNIETVIKKEKEKYNFTNLNVYTINRIRELFLLPETIEGKYLQNLIWTYPNTQKIIGFLCRYHFLNEERVQSNLGKLVENYEKAIKYAEKMKDTPRTIQLTLDNLI